MASFPQSNHFSKHYSFQPGPDPPQVQDLTQLSEAERMRLGGRQELIE